MISLKEFLEIFPVFIDDFKTEKFFINDKKQLNKAYYIDKVNEFEKVICVFKAYGSDEWIYQSPYKPGDITAKGIEWPNIFVEIYEDYGSTFFANGKEIKLDKEYHLIKEEIYIKEDPIIKIVINFEDGGSGVYFFPFGWSKQSPSYHTSLKTDSWGDNITLDDVKFDASEIKKQMSQWIDEAYKNITYNDIAKPESEGKTMEITLEDVAPNNRTLVMVYGSQNSPSDFRERAGRLVESMNGPETIKTVVVTVNGGRIFSGLNFTQPPDGGILDPNALQHVKERFVQVLEVKYGAA